MDQDRETIAASLWMLVAGAIDLLGPLHAAPAWWLAALAAAPLVARLGLLAWRGERREGLRASDMQALVVLQACEPPPQRPSRGRAVGRFFLRVSMAPSR